MVYLLQERNTRLSYGCQVPDRPDVTRSFTAICSVLGVKWEITAYAGNLRDNKYQLESFHCIKIYFQYKLFA